MKKDKTWNVTTEVVGSGPARVFFPDVDVGVAFQFLIQPREETSYKLLQMTHIKYTCR